MKTLCMDSAHKHLILVLLEDGEIKAQCGLECWKKQSETIFPELIKLCDSLGWSSEDIDEVIITDGPGSYTGVRIAMAIAKVFTTTMNKPLYTLSTLQLYAGMQDQVFVMLDARSQRAYCALYEHGQAVMEEQIMSLEEIQALLANHEYALAGDCELIGRDSIKIDFAKNFKELRPLAHKVENIHILTHAISKMRMPIR